MLSQKMQDALNEQLAREFYASHLYLSMSAYYEANNLPGFAHWMRMQSEEERMHALKFFDFINDRSGRVTLHAIEQPPGDFASALDAMQQALAHEQQVSAAINKLYDVAVQERDYAAQTLLHWFIDEQVEEEKTTSNVVEQLKLVGNEGLGLFMLDRQLADRQDDGAGEGAQA
jgi:ferritin